MKRIMLAIAMALLVKPTMAGTAPVAPPPPCESTTLDRNNRYELGLMLQALHPNHLPNDPANLPVYGPRFGVPRFGNELYVQAAYGSADPVSRGATTIILSEIGYQIPIELPFFHTFVEGGASYLHYTKPGVNEDMFGGDVGFGLILPMGRNFKLTLALKTYLQERAIISLGGGFSLLL